MEVHHHPHVEKKRFKEYFLEFLMIFLAVTLGFFAENLREHSMVKKTEKEYIHSLLEDLKSDSSAFDNVISANVSDLKNIDTAIDFLNSPVITVSISKILYYSHVTNPYFGSMSFNLRTIDQLKSAGGFRLISNQQVSDSIVQYNKRIEWVAWLRTELLDALRNDRESGFRIFNDFLVKGFEDPAEILSSRSPIRLLTTDKNILIPYANKLKMRYDWVDSYRNNLVIIKAQCNNLIKLIREKY